MPQNAGIMNMPDKRSVNFSSARNGLILHKPDFKAFLLPLKFWRPHLHHHLRSVTRHGHANNN